MRAVVSCDGSVRSPSERGGPENPGGCAGILEWPDGEHHPVAVVSGTVGGIGRLEVLGVVAALEHLASMGDPGECDVLVLVDSVYVERSATGQAGRKANIDLWDRFGAVGPLFRSVSIEHRPRNTRWSMEEADRIAGEFRLLMCDDGPAGEMARRALDPLGRFAMPTGEPVAEWVERSMGRRPLNQDAEIQDIAHGGSPPGGGSEGTN